MVHFFASFSPFTDRSALRTLGKRFVNKRSATFAELHTT
jgi:hypothetical protein